MLLGYIQAAMSHAEFEKMEDGRYFGTISLCRGVWADGDTVEACRSVLQEVLEDWILIRVRHGLDIPLVDGIDLNPKPAYAEAD